MRNRGMREIFFKKGGMREIFPKKIVSFGG
jgi:hypothetical protein